MSETARESQPIVLSSTASSPIALPSYGATAISILEDRGYEAWCVGGFVRDSLLGRTPGDIDIATNAHWTDVQIAFENAGHSTHETGVKHGTLTVVIDGFPVEVTTFRKEERYADYRHPESVTFVGSIEEDLARRDFTINALAYSPSRGLVDVFGGIEDIKSKTIRCVGDPQKRFKEDALRILRACRFCSQLGFGIEEDTLAAMKASKSQLRHVSTERITHEMEGLLLGDHAHDAIMETVDVLTFIIPELSAMKGFDQNTPYHIYDVLEHTAWVVQHTPPERLTRWAALFHDMGKPGAAFEGPDGVRHFYSHAHISVQLASAIMGRFLISPSNQNKILQLVKHHDDVLEPNARTVKRMLRRLNGDAELFEMLCSLKKADALSQAPFCHERAGVAEELRKVLGDILDSQEAFSLKHLEINGSDLISLGMAPGPAIGACLETILDKVINEEVANDHEELLALAQRMINEHR